MKPKILVVPGDELASRGRLFAALAEWLGVDFTSDSFEIRSETAAEIAICREESEVERSLLSDCAMRLIVFARPGEGNIGNRIVFSASPSLPAVLRQQELEQTVQAKLPRTCAGEMLAACCGNSIWSVREEKGSQIEFVAGTLPELEVGELLFDQFELPSWTGLLAVTNFVRTLTGNHGWHSPQPRACLMFDDPNLHWPSYGFIDYAKLSEHAVTHGYHASIATVPFDAWFVHPRAAAVFRSDPGHVSLLVHGNNHTRSELARPYTNIERRGLVAQSLKRIAHLEEISHCSIARVMTGPHGECNEEVARELLLQGYEAVCTDPSSLRRANLKWPASFALEPAEFFSNGMPVLPRFRLSTKCVQRAILAGFLGQPIIPVGHHQDVADGLTLLENISAKISQFGGVVWSDMTEIARSNFKHRLCGNILQLEMYSRHIKLEVSADVETVQMHRPRQQQSIIPGNVEARIDGPEWFVLRESEFKLPAATRDDRFLELRYVPFESEDYRKVPSASVPLWATIRRLLTEVRDRCHGHGG